MTASDYGRCFALWRVDCEEPWRAYTRHAFIEGLKDGTLPREAFLRYLVQDYRFLLHFSRAWALGVSRCRACFTPLRSTGSGHWRTPWMR